jgi:WD40 repeat protein
MYALAEGHEGQLVASVAIAPDLSLVISAGYDNEICLWKLPAGSSSSSSSSSPPVKVGAPRAVLRPVQRLIGHTDWVHSVALSVTESAGGGTASLTIASGGDDDTMRLWYLRPKKPSGAGAVGKRKAADGGSGAGGKSDCFEVRSARIKLFSGQFGVAIAEHAGSAGAPNQLTAVSVSGEVKIWDVGAAEQGAVGGGAGGEGAGTAGAAGDVRLSHEGGIEWTYCALCLLY